MVRLPSLMWGLIWLGPCLCLLGGSLFDVEDARLYAASLGLVGWLIALVLFMTFAWDRPYQGEFAVDPGAYELVYDQLMR